MQEVYQISCKVARRKQPGVQLASFPVPIGIYYLIKKKQNKTKPNNNQTLNLHSNFLLA